VRQGGAAISANDVNGLTDIFGDAVRTLSATSPFRRSSSSRHIDALPPIPRCAALGENWPKIVLGSCRPTFERRAGGYWDSYNRRAARIDATEDEKQALGASPYREPMGGTRIGNRQCIDFAN